MALDLVVLIAVPLALALPIYLLGRANILPSKWAALVVTAFTTVYSLVLWIQHFISGNRLDNATDGFLLHYKATWIESVGITFSFGVDGLSMPLVVLTNVIFFVAVISSFYIHDQEPLYYSMVLVLLTGVLGTFVALDIFLFYIFWELVLVPMFFIIHTWGGDNRRYAAMKFFIYTHLASLLLLIGLFLIYLNGQYTEASINLINNASGFEAISSSLAGSNTFYMPHLRYNLAESGISIGELNVIFWLVFIGFVTKFPSFPVHTWLPDAHTEAPSPGSAILAGLLLKMGGYGLFRIPFWMYSKTTFDGETFFQTATGEQARIIMAILGMISMAYPAFIALKEVYDEKDIKRVIAYSSISHMGIVLLGLAAYNKLGFNGAMYMMIAHGIISPGLFLLSGIIEHNTKNHTRDIGKVGGLAHKMPFTGGMFVFLAFASAGLPGLAGFVAEFTAFVGMFTDTGLLGSPQWIWIPIVSVLSIIVTAGYYLYSIQKIVYNEATDELENTEPAKWYESVPVFILSVLALIFGLIPSLVWYVLDQWSEGVLGI